ncbi:sensor domain-containing diguanylate cyclase [Alicyclobacillus sp. SO9]|uniref:sensor domain-containing diguanylate cyclase n=1 Tax=Alicyclobacillus sp. SO9 TaxID=2665646 RepID=UPI0018E885C6|nr:sensor domain-containing diguanylate cyclase [Alicyclobacillus sp. SO9]QQE79934.1 GGDEF domain-containing protein [Alicyclobacillus sp. SO9]
MNTKPSSTDITDALRRLEELEWFEQCLIVTTEAPTVLSMLSQIRELMLQKFSYDRMGIMSASLDPRYCVIHELVTKDTMQACPPGSLMIIKNTGLEWVFNHKAPHYSPNITNEPEFLEDEELAQIGLRSIIRVPLVFNSKVFGVMTLKSCKENAYTPEQVSLLHRLGQRIAAGIHALKLIQDLRELSHRDALTRAYNRYFLNELQAADNPVEYLERTTHLEFPYSQNVAALFIDVCNFKEYNDTHGHLEGDKRIQELSASLTDIVGDEGIVIRFGGDEFLILLPGGNRQALMQVEQRLRQGFRTNSYEQTLEVSIGTATGKWSGLTTIVEAADKRMYKDKDREKDRENDKEKNAATSQV